MFTAILSTQWTKLPNVETRDNRRAKNRRLQGCQAPQSTSLVNQR